MSTTTSHRASILERSPRDPQTVLSSAAQALRRICDRQPDGVGPSPAAVWLLDNYSYLRSEIRELQQALSPGFCRKLAQDGREFRIHGIVADALGQIQGPLTAPALIRFLAPEQLQGRFGFTLSLAELWAIPPITKLVLIEELCAAISKQPLESTDCEAAVEAAIARLRSTDRILWNPLIEAISVVDIILRRDPASVYAQMEFESRDSYRHVIEEIAKGSNRPEEAVAQCAISLAAAAPASDDGEQASHVGYYLIGEGLADLLSTGGFHLPLAQALHRHLLRAPSFIYAGGIFTVTAILTAAFYLAVFPAPLWLMALIPLPMSQVAVSLVNLAMNLIFKPRQLPRLDFSKGIPGDCRTFVVIPTLLLSRAGVERLVERLEIHYLANRDQNLLFALLTDFPDASSASAPNDVLLEYCADRIERLNRAHAGAGGSPFYLFHRPRAWNERESVWMGRERKRGKLEDFNSYLLGLGNAFSTIVGKSPDAQAVRYVITLDSDTQLPRDTAWKMIGTMAHPLNQARMDANGLIRSGYAILQPRVSISMESSGKSRLARVYSGQTGLDPYSRAISDVYQDLFARATFTGKGLYDLRAFHRLMNGRFPDNSILSHDLIEGEHARVGLVTDIDVIDDYPATYEAYSKRKHRWIRGDWQILPWLFSRVPSAVTNAAPNILLFLPAGRSLIIFAAACLNAACWRSWLQAGFSFHPLPKQSRLPP